MAKIKVTSKCELYDGMSITFNAPCDCTEVDGLNVYYENTSQSFSFRDANGNDLAGYPGLFSEGAYVKAVLDTRRGYAFLQNADSSSYLEMRFDTLLSEETKMLYGLESDAIPDDAFKRIAQLYGAYGFYITLVTSDGFPIPNMPLEGLLNAFRNDVAVTDENGKCFAVADTATPTIRTSTDIYGLANIEKTLEADDGKLVTPLTVVMPVDTSLKLIETSGTYTMLPNHPVDFCLVGAGASGSFYSVSGENQSASGLGGGGGYVTNILNELFHADDNQLTVEIGAGTPSSVSGVHAAGGATKLYIHNVEHIAEGASEQVGNGNGGTRNQYQQRVAATEGTVHVFGDTSLLKPGGGGGGGRSGDYGAGFGGRAGYPETAPTSGTGPGGGGGAGYWNTNTYGNYNNAQSGAAGHAGGLYIRFKEVPT